MATKRGDKSRFELVGYQRREDEFIERVVLATDTLQGIALLYNTSVAELKKLNHLHAEGDLHAHRVIKVPSKGILINLEDEVGTSLLPNVSNEVLLSQSDEEETNGQSYLNNVDSVLKEIKEKAEIAAANSPIFNGSENSQTFAASSRQNGELKWWKLFLPCVGILIGFPVLYFIYLQHMHHIGENNATISTQT